ncbi:hypothetical protein A6S26_13495 [Nostoc sp. ATCC 43529]|nr:hypothetical protein A6S26_13495 [Nostoc sp. ATCC 43529]
MVQYTTRSGESTVFESNAGTNPPQFAKGQQVKNDYSKDAMNRVCNDYSKDAMNRVCNDYSKDAMNRVSTNK